MAKHKKKQSKKESVPDSFLDVTAISIKKYRKVTNEIAKLSAKQKVVGSLALAAAGYFYLNKLRNDNSENSVLADLRFFFPGLFLDKAPPAPTQSQDTLEDTAASDKISKTSKSGKGTGAFGKKSAASEHDL